MKFKQINYIFYICLGIGIFFESKASNWFSQYEAIKNNIVLVAADGSYCSGGYLGNGFVITAAHCTPYLFYSQVSFPEVSSEFYEAKVVYRNEEKDLSLLFLSKEIPGGLSLRSPSKKISKFEEIYAVGHPGINFFSLKDKESTKLIVNTVTEGVISNFNDSWIRTTLRSDRGGSGSVVLDKENQVTGVVSSLDSSMVLAANITTMNETIEKNKVKQNQVDWYKADNSFDLYFWIGFHSYLESIEKTKRLDYLEFDFDLFNRFRFGISGNAGKSLSMGSQNIGYKIPLIGKSNQLSFLVLGIEKLSYLLNPNAAKEDEFDFRRGSGFYVLINSGQSGLAIKLSMISIDSSFHTIANIGVFF